MKSTKLFLKNAFKTAFRNISQILGLSFLVMLVSMLSALLSATSTRVITANNNFTEKSNMHDFVLPIDMNLKFEAPKDENDKLIKIPNTQESFQHYILNELTEKAKKQGYNINFSRTEGRTLSSVKYNNESLKIKAVVKTGLIKNDIENNDVDKLVISKGRDIDYSKDTKDQIFSNYEIVVQEQFALQHKLEIGDIIRLQQDEYGDDIRVKTNEAAKKLLEDNNDEIIKADPNLIWFKIVGFGSSADFTMPTLDESSPMPNANAETLTYISPRRLGLMEAVLSNESKIRFYNFESTAPNQLTVSSEYDREVFYSFKMSGSNVDYKDNKEKILSYLNGEIANISKIKDREKFLYDINDKTYKYNSRTSAFNDVINAFQMTSSALLIIILAISLFASAILTKKQIENAKTQIGYFKALGYKKREIVNNFIAVPLIVSVIGSLLGYIIALLIEPATVSTFWKYFSIPHVALSFNIFSFLTSTILVFLVFLVLSLSLAYFTIKDSVLELLGSSGTEAISKLGIKIKKIASKRRFNTRLRLAILTTSMGKLAGVGVTMLLGTILMTTTIVSPKLLKDNVDATFVGLDYTNQIEYSGPVANNPLSFSKTYDPSQTSWKFEENTATKKYTQYNKTNNNDWSQGGEDDYRGIYDMIASGKINDQYYAMEVATNNGVGYSKMSYLNWMNLSSSFLTSLDNYVGGGLDAIVANSLGEQWTDHDNLQKKVNTKIVGDDTSADGLEIAKQKFMALSSFYSKYLKTINLSWNKNVMIDEEKIDSKKFISNTLKKEIIAAKFGYNNFINTDSGALTVKSENSEVEDSKKQGIDLTYFEKIKPEVKLSDLGFNKESKEIVTLNGKNFNINDILASDDSKQIREANSAMLMWYGLTFSYRVGQYVLQTTYSRAPYFVQQYMKNSIENNDNYNILFNVVPFNPEQDELGTMLNGTYSSKVNKTENIKIYGINKGSKLLNLRDRNNKLLTDIDEFWVDGLDDGYNPIIINETTAKKLGKKVGDTFDTDIALEMLSDKENNIIDINDNQKIQFKRDKEWGELVLPTNDNLGTTLINGKKAVDYQGKATELLQSIKSGETKITQNSESRKFKIIGVQNGYGRAQAWIPNKNAEKINKYNDLRNYLFKNQFLLEQTGLKISSKAYTALYGTSAEKGLLGDQAKNIHNFIRQISSLNFTDTYDLFLREKAKYKNMDAYKYWDYFDKIFQNSYPVFNYKNQLNPEIYDLTKGFSTVQKFGEYGVYGLNGGYETITNDSKEDAAEPQYYQGYGIGATKGMSPSAETRQILTQITDIVNSVVLMFLFIALIVSTTIILLVVNLIIYENRKFISTFKVLGYSDGYIIRQILGMYLVIIFATFIIGFIIGWYTFVVLLNKLALYSSWVIPIQFGWWLPFAVFAIIFGIYWITFAMSYARIHKIKAVHALQIKD